MKLNIGCGDSYIDGFINIDGSTEVKTDKVIDISKDSLTNHFAENSVEYILASDILEHHFHWEAVQLLKDCLVILQKDGILDIRVPDCEHIINSQLPLEVKLTSLYGGQDVPQCNNAVMNESRKQYPEYFCHKYGWTKDRLRTHIYDIGYSGVEFKNADTNICCKARK